MKPPDTTTTFRGVVFDLDATLVDSLDDVAAALSAAFESADLPPVTTEQVAPAMGYGSLDLVRAVMGAVVPGGSIDETLIGEIHARYHQRYAARPAALTTIFGGGTAALPALRQSGIRVGVCTNKSTGLAVEVLHAVSLDAGPAQVVQLDTALDRLTRAVRTDAGVDIDEIAGGGAAGGIAAGMVGLLDAEIASGSDLILGMLGLTQQVPDVDVVLTGEGKLDRQSLYGKAPVSVARIAREHAVPTIALAGVTEAAARDELAEVFVLTGSMVEHAGTEQALGEPAAVLRDLTHSIFHDWLHRWERP